ncbi:hypothetical protein SAMN07250955_1122 [Arboricoccus pini]|uniref:Uncharacterized protein n=1 Tax=Arboricoccus pini TaxID=1963835 RepID=A0A212RQ39_9PROT|nr:hypothetical protein [Arboricoccus pini]SNB74530.1 hypothetical protein SAMN07250955_1122 [Arboricoccus pini]
MPKLTLATIAALGMLTLSGALVTAGAACTQHQSASAQSQEKPPARTSGQSS